LRAS